MNNELLLCRDLYSIINRESCLHAIPVYHLTHALKLDALEVIFSEWFCLIVMVKPLNRGHIGDGPFVPCRAVVLLSEVLFYEKNNAFTCKCLECTIFCAYIFVLMLQLKYSKSNTIQNALKM